MNNLFTKEEKECIIKNSHFLYDDVAADDNFSLLFDTIVSSFFCEEKDLQGIKDLFYPDNELFIFKVFFEPFWKIVLYLCKDVEWESAFSKGAFSDFKETFINALYENFGYTAKKSMEDMLDEKCPPHSGEWFEKKANPNIFSGKHFHYMALKYSIYAKQLSYFIYDYVNHIKEIVYEINNELPKIYGEFFLNEKICKVKKVSTSNSDRHNHGKSVHIITFEDGKKLVYKPHSLSIDRAWNEMIRWTCDSMNIDSFISIKSIDTLNGGFCTFIEPKEVECEKDVNTFFMNQGILLCLIYLLRGNDIHAENIIAVGKKPVIVDMETVINPPKILLSKMQGDFKRSVLFPAFLPVMGILPGFNNYGIDSLTAIYMKSHNLPMYGEKCYNGSDYAQDVIKGFRLVADFFVNNREAFCKKIKECFLGSTIRMVIKPTSLYCKTIMILATESNIKDINQYEKTITYLNKEYPDRIKDDIEYIKEMEHVALQRLDVPYFYCTLSNVELNELEKELEKIDAKDFDDEIEKIGWALKKGKTSDDIDVHIEIEEIDKSVSELLDENVDILLDVLDEKYKELISVEQEGIYLMNLGESKYYPLLDATLGIYVALAAYSKINKSNIRVNEKLANIYNAVYEKVIKMAGFTYTVPGLADGLAGIFIGSRLLYEMKVITKDIYFGLIKDIENMSDTASKVLLNSNGFLYGNKGLLVALYKIMEDYRSDKLNNIVTELVSAIYNKKELSDIEKEELFKEAKKELFSNNKSSIDAFSSNNTLVYGNAGVLYNNTQMTKKEGLEKFVKNLLNVKSAIKNNKPPKNSVEVGLFTGLSGIVYSVCKYINNNDVPAII